MVKRNIQRNNRAASFYRLESTTSKKDVPNGKRLAITVPGTYVFVKKGTGTSYNQADRAKFLCQLSGIIFEVTQVLVITIQQFCPI